MLKYLILLILFSILVLPVYGNVNGVEIISVVMSDEFENPLNVILVNQKIIITAEIENHFLSYEDYGFVLQVYDKNGIQYGDTSWISGQLSPSQSYTVPLVWITPSENGIYLLHIVLWNNIREQEPINDIIELTINVTGGQTTNLLTITTNQPSYQTGDTIYITGKTQNPTNGTSVSISMGLPDGTTSPISNVISSGANQFTTTIQTGNNTTVYIPGSYSLTAQYGNSTAFTTFDYYDTTDEEEEQSLFTLSNHELSKWTHQLEKWENAQNRTDSSIERLELKLDRALTNNNTNQIIAYTERINNSMALSELYGVMIDSLQEQLDSYP